MEIEEGKVEIDEIDFKFFLIHVFYKVLPCEYTDLMGANRIERKHSRVNKMTVLGAKQVFFLKIYLLIMRKNGKISVFLDYYNILYEIHYEKW
jgi:hypothetical protein